MADFVSSVDGWLRSERGVSCKREWLEACLAWIQQEEVCYNCSVLERMLDNGILYINVIGRP